MLFEVDQQQLHFKMEMKESQNYVLFSLLNKKKTHSYKLTLDYDYLMHEPKFQNIFDEPIQVMNYIKDNFKDIVLNPNGKIIFKLVLGGIKRAAQQIVLKLNPEKQNLKETYIKKKYFDEKMHYYQLKMKQFQMILNQATKSNEARLQKQMVQKKTINSLLSICQENAKKIQMLQLEKTDLSKNIVHCKERIILMQNRMKSIFNQKGNLIIDSLHLNSKQFEGNSNLCNYDKNIEHQNYIQRQNQYNSNYLEQRYKEKDHYQSQQANYSPDSQQDQYSQEQLSEDDEVEAQLYSNTNKRNNLNIKIGCSKQDIKYSLDQKQIQFGWRACYQKEVNSKDKRKINNLLNNNLKLMTKKLNRR